MILEKVVGIRGQETRISDRFIFFLVESEKFRKTIFVDVLYIFIIHLHICKKKLDKDHSTSLHCFSYVLIL